MFSKTKIALSAAIVLSTAFPASAATKHHRVTHVHPAIYDTAPAAQSDQIPVLDVNPVCRRIASQSDLEGGLRQTNFEECVKNEQAVRDEIKKECSAFTAADKTPIVLPWLRPKENRVTPSLSPVWKWRATFESCTATLTACLSRTYHRRRHCAR